MVCRFPAHNRRSVYATDHAVDKKCFNKPMRMKLPVSIIFMYRASMTIKTLYYPTDAQIYNS